MMGIGRWILGQGSVGPVQDSVPLQDGKKVIRRRRREHDGSGLAGEPYVSLSHPEESHVRRVLSWYGQSQWGFMLHELGSSGSCRLFISLTSVACVGSLTPQSFGTDH